MGNSRRSWGALQRCFRQLRPPRVSAHTGDLERSGYSATINEICPLWWSEPKYAGAYPKKARYFYCSAIWRSRSSSALSRCQRLVRDPHLSPTHLAKGAMVAESPAATSTK